MTEESITSSYVRRERRTTAMLTPFMPCGAKLPVIALFASVFFADAAWVGTGFVPGLIAVVVVILAAAVGYIVKKKKSGAACIGCPDGGSCSHCQGGGSCHGQK